MTIPFYLFYKQRTKKFTDLFFQHNLLDVNRTLVDKLSVAEKCLTLSLGTKEERASQQEMLEMLLAYGVDLNVPMIKEKPQGSPISLLGLLVFRALNIANNPDFYSLRLQKFIALFFDLQGTSISNNTLCVHPYMLDVFAHWNFVLDLYSKELQNMPRIPLFETQIANLYSDDGTYDPALSYQRYQHDAFVVFPVHLRGMSGEAHVATVGFMKIAGSNRHLRVEADRGMSREDFTVFEEPAFETESALCAFTHTLHKKISLETWQAVSFHKTKIMSIPIGKQRSSSCASQSIKYAFLISHFLYELQQANHLQRQSNSKKQAFFQEVFQGSNQWFTCFLIRMQEALLQKYKALDTNILMPIFRTLGNEHLVLKNTVTM
jgi:hypothetical protein